MKFARRPRHSLRLCPFEVVGAEVAQGGVPVSGVVLALDEFEDRHACLAGLDESPTCREDLNATLRRAKIFTEGSWWPRKNKGPIGEVW